jgi:hypothetical protein
MVSRSDLSLVGVIGDVHGEDEYLEAALAFFERAGVGRVLSVGDIVDGEGGRRPLLSPSRGLRRSRRARKS